MTLQQDVDQSPARVAQYVADLRGFVWCVKRMGFRPGLKKRADELLARMSKEQP